MNNEERADRIAEEMVANLNYNVLKEAAETEKAHLLSLLFKALAFSAESILNKEEKTLIKHHILIILYL